MANVQVLLTNGILRIGELADQAEEAFTAEYVISTAMTGIGFLIVTGKEGNTAYLCSYYIWFPVLKNA